jgi:hypothetical protein
VSANKAEYPHRPDKRGKPKASHQIHRKSKTWLSERTEVKGGLDISPRIGLAWWKSPLMKAARLAKAESLRT